MVGRMVLWGRCIFASGAMLEMAMQALARQTRANRTESDFAAKKAPRRIQWLFDLFDLFVSWIHDTDEKLLKI
jgi:hypothetical protein